MATRIRTIKPEVARHKTLVALEQFSGLPIRFAWVALFTVADREGRFVWDPENLKLDVLPHDDCNFEHVLDLFHSAYLIHKFEVLKKIYGFIPTWSSHQVINVREAQSKIPDPELGLWFIPPRLEKLKTHNSAYVCTCTHCKKTKPSSEFDLICKDCDLDIATVTSTCMHVHAHGEGKGIGKGKGTGREVKNIEKTLGSRIFETYRVAFEDRYPNASPVRNQKTNSICKQLGERLGEDALEVVKFYIRHNDAWYLKKQHDLDSLLSNAESLHTQWQRNQPVTNVQVRQFEKQSVNMDLLDQVKRGEL